MTQDTREKFIVYPEYNDSETDEPLPIFETEDGTWISYGHVEPRIFLTQVRNLFYYLAGEDFFADFDPEEAIHWTDHTYGEVSSEKGEFYVDWSTANETTENAVPITILWV